MAGELSDQSSPADALPPVIDAALTALEEALDLLEVAAGDGAEVGSLATSLVGFAERLGAAAEQHATGAAEAAADPDAALTAPGALLDAARACLEAAAESLDEALAAVEPGEGAATLDAGLGRAVLRASNRLHDAARTLADTTRDASQRVLLLRRSPAAEQAARLPVPAVDHIVATPLGPRTVHVTWSLTPVGLDRAQAALPTGASARPMLRLYRAGDAPADVQDRALDDWIGHAEVTVPPDGRLVCALGLVAESGFVHIARAVPVQMPPLGPGDGAIRFTRVAWRDEGGRAQVSDAKPSGPAPRLAAASTPRPALDLSRIIYPSIEEQAR